VKHRAKREWPGFIFEQRTTGDVFVVPDPQLRLDEVESVQNEVAQLASRSGEN